MIRCPTAAWVGELSMTMGKFIMTLGFLTLAACAKGFDSAKIIPLDFSSLAESECLNDSTTSACVFQKNPLAASGLTAFPSLIGETTELGAFQSLAVTIDNLDASGFLQNASINVTAEQGERAQALNGSWKFRFKGDASAKAVQVHTYYWLNKAIQDLKAVAGVVYAEGKAIEVAVNAAETGWLPAQNKITLQRNASGNQLALDAGFAVHMLGQANIHHASNGQINDLGLDTNHADCGLTGGAVFQKDCCVAANGCSRALQIGAADYMVALIFPENPTLGETWVNRSSGLDYCGFSRDLRRHQATTAQQAFGACTSRGASGQIFPMGTLYASMWFEIRKSVKAALPTRLNDFDRLYMLHLAQLQGQDTFATAITKIKAIDVAEFGTAFSPYFDAEVTRRGL